MAKLKALPGLRTISGFRGKIDYYLYHPTCNPELKGAGIPCARKWPRSPGHKRAPLVEAEWPLFTYASQHWVLLSKEVQDSYRKMAEATGLSGRDMFTRSYLRGLYRIPIEEEEEMKTIWIDNTPQVVTLVNQNANLPWTEVDLAAHTSPTAFMALIHVEITVKSVTRPNWVGFFSRKKGTAPAVTRMFQIKSEIGPFTAWAQMEQQLWVGLNEDQEFEYKTERGGNPLTWDVEVRVLSYIET